MKIEPHASRRITLIGMAGTGKSTWAGRLATRGTERVDCDRLIAEGLSMQVAEAFDLIEALGRWMGLPWEEGYDERAGVYQAMERDVMTRVVERLENQDPDRARVIIDTAGSVIYTGRDILERLASQTLMVHLETPVEVRERMLEDFIRRPGPVIWNGMFERDGDEPVHRALARCYPRLLAQREERYRGIAHITVPHTIHRGRGTRAEDFISFLAPEAAPGSDPQVG